MYELEKQVKDIIIAKYGSLKRFCEEVDMPWSTLDSILKRGFTNSNIGNVLKVARELDIEVEPLAFGVLQKRVPAPADPLHLTEQEKHIISIYHDLDRVGQEKFTAFGEGLLAAARAEDRRGYYTFTPYENYMVAESGPEYQMWSNKVNDQLMEDADRISKKEIGNASKTKKMVK